MYRNVDSTNFYLFSEITFNSFSIQLPIYEI